MNPWDEPREVSGNTAVYTRQGLRTAVSSRGQPQERRHQAAKTAVADTSRHTADVWQQGGVTVARRNGSKAGLGSEAAAKT